ncbi:hypothetical protein [Mixta calida]|uniref:hypothetical protein n=1 Tax=Mixta calida TaxID=665913 RepID=UPI002897E4D4|nr:hypothetical protein [Mixta calida]
MSYQKRPKLGIVAALYVLFIMSWLSLVLIFFPLGFYIDITQTISSGAVTNSSGFAFNMIQSVLVFLIPTFFIPWLRNMYQYFPWLLPFVVICTLNLIIFGVGSEITNKGFEVSNSTRHTIFTVLVVAQIIASRLAMSAYFHFRPLKPLR